MVISEASRTGAVVNQSLKDSDLENDPDALLDMYEASQLAIVSTNISDTAAAEDCMSAMRYLHSYYKLLIYTFIYICVFVLSEAPNESHACSASAVERILMQIIEPPSVESIRSAIETLVCVLLY